MLVAYSQRVTAAFKFAKMNTQPEINFEELHERIRLQFEDYKEKLNSTDYPTMNDLLNDVKKESDMLWFEVKFETDQFLNKHLANRNAATACEERRRVKKAEYLIKLQSLTSMMTCHVMKDYKRMLEEGKSGANDI